MRNSSSKLAHDPPEPEVARHSAQVLQFGPPARWGEQRYSSSPSLGKEPDDQASELLDDLARYEQDAEEEPINYRQRMLMNVISVAIVTVILGIGVWIANNLT
jgi:hypothetical protein